MKIKYGKEGYSASGGKHEFNPKYDFLLFRQDFNGNESVYFNLNELDKILNKIDNGDILIHYNYSILYCKNNLILKKVEDSFPCFCVVSNKKMVS